MNNVFKLIYYYELCRISNNFEYGDLWVELKERTKIKEVKKYFNFIYDFELD